VQAFLVGSVDNIVNLNWENILPPPAAAGKHHYLTAITRIGDEIVEIIDVEKVLSEVVPLNSSVSKNVLDQDLAQLAKGMEILVVDDSSTGLNQVRDTVSQLGIKLITESDGLRALNLLKRWATEGIDVAQKLLMVITDAEMPEMDGYRLTAEIRADSRLKDLYVCLHTSLSGSFNEAMVKTVGCDAFLSKFAPDDLAKLVQTRIRQRLDEMKK
jgi:two-component system chemotaxis response regulator CheV